MIKLNCSIKVKLGLIALVKNSLFHYPTITKTEKAHYEWFAVELSQNTLLDLHNKRN